jgi:poly-gamma-glutamate capsule biosynthesis protein CapA/YwtB (metallophosphatase superfamily)
MSQDDSEATVVVAGDVRPVSLRAESLMSRLELAKSPDLALWTLDAAIAAGEPAENQTCIPFRDDDLEGFRIGRANLVVTASNHVTDFGQGGLSATLAALGAHDFRHVGAGMDRDEAARTAFVDLPQGRIAVLAFAETTPRVAARPAGPDKAGIRPYEEAACLDAVADARRHADWVWVVLHWGEEFIRYPDPVQRRAGWRMVDAGASLVVASHTHVPLGWERRGDAAIFYGLGNFVYPAYTERRGFRFSWHPRSRRGVVALGRLVRGAWDWTPIAIRHDAHGLPHRDTATCEDFGRSLPQDAEAYERLYARLRARDRAGYLVERLLFMGLDERMFRVRNLARRFGSRRV